MVGPCFDSPNRSYSEVAQGKMVKFLLHNNFSELVTLNKMFKKDRNGSHLASHMKIMKIFKFKSQRLTEDHGLESSHDLKILKMLVIAKTVRDRAMQIEI